MEPNFSGGLAIRGWSASIGTISTCSGTRPRPARALISALLALLCLLAAFAALALAGAPRALAYTHEWRCKPANDTWCFDPNGKSDWQEGKVKLEKGYNAYLCVGVFNEPWGADVCTESRVPAGNYLDWQFGTAFSSHDPLHGAGLQENAYGNAQEIWNWFYEP